MVASSRIDGQAGNEGYEARRPGSLEEDPILARIEMSMTSGGDEIAKIVMAGARTPQAGGDIMNALIGLMAKEQERPAPVATSTGGGGSNAAPIALGILTGVAGAVGGIVSAVTAKKVPAVTTASADTSTQAGQTPDPAANPNPVANNDANATPVDPQPAKQDKAPKVAVKSAKKAPVVVAKKEEKAETETPVEEQNNPPAETDNNQAQNGEANVEVAANPDPAANNGEETVAVDPAVEPNVTAGDVTQGDEPNSCYGDEFDGPECNQSLG